MSTVENANINIETIRAMKQANEAMRGIHKGMGVNKIDDTMCVFPPSVARLFSRHCFTIRILTASL